MKSLAILLIIGGAMLSLPVMAQPGGGGGGGRPGGGFRPGGGGGAGESAVQPWEEAIKGYTAQTGALNTYVKDETVLFEVPKSAIGRDFLWYIELKATPGGSYSGQDVAEATVRFEKRGDKLLLRQIDYDVRAVGDNAIKLAVEQSNVMPIIATLDIKSESPDGGQLVDVTRLFKSGLPELPMARSLGGAQFDSSRTFIDKVNAFPDNVNLEVTATASGGAAAPLGGLFGGGGQRQRPSATGCLHHSIVLLPEKPMMGRLRDQRVGFFSSGFMELDSNKQGTQELAFIDRFRLEKKDPSKAVSDPVKPIVFYIAPEVPTKWHKAIKLGIEDWQSAFQAAGFSNAILCKEAPDDKNWSPEDVRYNVIRWAPLPVENAMGPHVSDPRSGEILSAHVIVWHDVLKLAGEWYFAQASPNDPRARIFPLPDNVMSDCMRFVVSHEVGHTLGLPHNGKSSGMIPVELLRNKKWTDENGTCTSIMDYARFNYVAQPGDGAWLIPKIGRYDKFAIKWGYTPLTASKTPWEEKRQLDIWASAQVKDPMLRFYDNFNSFDPTTMSETLGDDAVIADTYGLKNLRRVITYVEPASVRLGEDFTELNRVYGAVWGQYGEYVGHVSQMVGGVIQTDYLGGRGGANFTPVKKDRQKAAVKWLIDNVLETPAFMIPNGIVAKLGPGSGRTRVAGMQRRVISGMLSESRMQRMLDNSAMYGKSAYTVGEMMTDLRNGIWRDLSGRSASIDVYRRGMQRMWVTSLIDRYQSPTSETRSAISGELRTELGLLQRSAGKAADAETRAHLDDLARLIDQTLKFPPQPAPAAAAPATGQGGGRGPRPLDLYGCGFVRSLGNDESGD